MKPPRFSYAAPRSLEAALGLLEQHGDSAKLLAGGQSLVPVLNFRLASPAVLIDLNRVAGLDGITRSADGGLCVGAMARWRKLEQSELVAQSNPLLSHALTHVAHVQIRNRGTIGGSFAHADPAAEVPAVAVACGAEILLSSRQGVRRLSAADFFQGVFTTALGPHEILSEIRFPPWPVRRRWGFQEIARRHGDFAIVGAIALLDLAPSDACEAARVVVFGASDKPLRLPDVEQMLAGQHRTTALLRAAGDRAAAALEPRGDLHASADYRRELTAVLVRRALDQAWADSAEAAA